MCGWKDSARLHSTLLITVCSVAKSCFGETGQFLAFQCPLVAGDQQGQQGYQSPGVRYPGESLARTKPPGSGTGTSPQVVVLTTSEAVPPRDPPRRLKPLKRPKTAWTLPISRARPGPSQRFWSPEYWSRCLGGAVCQRRLGDWTEAVLLLWTCH